MEWPVKQKMMVVGMFLVCLSLFTACGATSTTPAVVHASATLVHAPHGSSNLVWNASNHTLTVKVSASGLAPKSTHPAHIHAGNCTSDGPIVYTLNPLVADSKGTATSVTTIQQVTTSIPASGWHINIHNGPRLASAFEALPIACGDVVNTQRSTSTTVTLASSASPNQAASGNTLLSLDGGKLLVKITLNSLQPNSTHMAHIHSGSCDVQGAVIYPLNPVVADAHGTGTSTTTVNNVPSIPSSGWYVNVHLSPDAAGLNTQTGFDPIACGNVVVH